MKGVSGNDSGGFSGNPGGVGPHVGDQPHRLTGPQVDAFIELLSDHHGFFGGKAKFLNRLLLELAGDEGWHGIAPCSSFDDFVNDVLS